MPRKSVIRNYVSKFKLMLDDTTEMLLWLQENTEWNYVLRTSPQIYISTGFEERKIRDIPLKKNP